jgi:hypothetical protein
MPKKKTIECIGLDTIQENMFGLLEDLKEAMDELEEILAESYFSKLRKIQNNLTDECDNLTANAEVVKEVLNILENKILGDC